MSVAIIKGEKGVGIPKNSTVRIETLPDLSVVWKGEVTDHASINLDPGHYVYSVLKVTNPRRRKVYKFIERFYHDITKDKFEELIDTEPKMHRSIMTSGGVRMRCQYIGCDEESTSIMGALIHEGTHFGIDVLASEPKKREEVQTKAENFSKQLHAKTKAKARMGGSHRL